MVDPMFEVPSSGDKSFIVTGDFVNSQLEKAHFGKMDETEMIFQSFMNQLRICHSS